MSSHLFPATSIGSVTAHDQETAGAIAPSTVGAPASLLEPDSGIAPAVPPSTLATQGGNANSTPHQHVQIEVEVATPTDLSSGIASPSLPVLVHLLNLADGNPAQPGMAHSVTGPSSPPASSPHAPMDNLYPNSSAQTTEPDHTPTVGQHDQGIPSDTDSHHDVSQLTLPALPEAVAAPHMLPHTSTFPATTEPQAAIATGGFLEHPSASPAINTDNDGTGEGDGDGDGEGIVDATTAEMLMPLLEVYEPPELTGPVSFLPPPQFTHTHTAIPLNTDTSTLPASGHHHPQSLSSAWMSSAYFGSEGGPGPWGMSPLTLAASPQLSSSPTSTISVPPAMSGQSHPLAPLPPSLPNVSSTVSGASTYSPFSPPYIPYSSQPPSSALEDVSSGSSSSPTTYGHGMDSGQGASGETEHAGPQGHPLFHLLAAAAGHSGGSASIGGLWFDGVSYWDSATPSTLPSDVQHEPAIFRLSLAREWAKQGNRFYKRGWLNDAQLSFSKAIETALPNDPQIYIYHSARAMVCLRRKHYDDVIDDCTTALQMRPSHVDSYVKRGLAFQELCNFEASEMDFYAAQEYGLTSTDLYLERLQALRAASIEATAGR
eukprot:TRINITY_DN1282_c0_g1_i1.p1 TRINITY_DN1282_c0_g1~~TRINITY_DN1282_c0_g1_i1.p1  ORF type:complete len:601 (+),score=43.78 TRINITY_DN1282_c0_g1_i1:584-2386(+)